MVACIWCVATGAEGFAIIVAFCVVVRWVRAYIHKMRCKCECHNHKCDKDK